MKAIETTYRGYRFRSRLEARWAVFFDALGMQWEYEPEGFDLDGMRYLPDFHLPELKHWVEVKPSDEALQLDAPKLAGFVSALPRNEALLLLSGIPDERAGCFVHPVMWCGTEGQHLAWCAFFALLSNDDAPRLARLDLSQGMAAALDIRPDERDIGVRLDRWTCSHQFFHQPRPLKRVHDAYSAARRARFEHGETPRTT